MYTTSKKISYIYKNNLFSGFNNYKIDSINNTLVASPTPPPLVVLRPEEGEALKNPQPLKVPAPLEAMIFIPTLASSLMGGGGLHTREKGLASLLAERGVCL